METGNTFAPCGMRPCLQLPRLATPGALLMRIAFQHGGILLTGGGTTVLILFALENVQALTRNFHDAEALCNYVQVFYIRQKPVAGALYKVFRDSPDSAMKDIKQAFFDYLSIGCVFSSGLVVDFFCQGSVLALESSRCTSLLLCMR